MIIIAGNLIKVNNKDIADGKLIIPQKVKSISSIAFRGCGSLTEITLPASVIRSRQFKQCDNLKKVIVKGGYQIGDFAFEGCNSLTSIEISESVTAIGWDAFEGCSNLTEITLPASVIRSALFDKCDNLKKVIVKGGTKIEDSAFADCSSLTSIKLPEGLTQIGKFAFYGCSSLTNIELPESVTEIGSYAFMYCSNLTSIKLSEGLTQIGLDVFEGCSNLTEITLPASVIRSDLFDKCDNLKKVIVKGGTKIEDSAFADCSNLTSIKLPEGLTQIGRSAFSGCRSLTSLGIPESVTRIDEDAFCGCSNLTSIKLPEGLTQIGRSAFKGCSSLTSIKLPESVTEIGRSAFEGCSSLTSIKLLEGLTQICHLAFNGCSSLTNIELPESVTRIDEDAFCGCSNLTSIKLPEGLTQIGRSAFMHCRSLTSIKLPESVTEIGRSAFEGCSSLTSIKLPEGLTQIGRSAFSGCRSLTSLGIPESVTGIDEDAFAGCSSLTEIEFGGVRIDSPKDIKVAKKISNKYGTSIIVDFKSSEEQKREPIYKFQVASMEDMERSGVIEPSLSLDEKQKQYSIIKEKINRIYSNCQFSKSPNYDVIHAEKYISKMLDVIGLDATDNLMRVLQNLTPEDIGQAENSILQAYDRRNNVQGDLPVLLAFFQSIKTYMPKGVNTGELYKRFNEELEKGEGKNVRAILEKVSTSMGFSFETGALSKMQRNIQEMQLGAKYDKIKSNVLELVNHSALNHRGIVNTIINNVLKENILADGTYDNIAEVLHKELSRVKEDGTNFYGDFIINQEAGIHDIITTLYNSKPELMRTNMVQVLQDTRAKLGKGWIRKLDGLSRLPLKDMKALTADEKEILEKYLEDNKMTALLPEYKAVYRLKDGISLEDAYKVLDANHIEGLLTYEKAAMMFGGINEPYSKEFGKWFAEHADEIMKNSKYYSKVSEMHNMFEEFISDPSTRTLYENGGITVKELCKKLEGNVLDENSTELSVEAEKLPGITPEDYEKMKLIYEYMQKREKSAIPSVENSGKRYRGRLLRADEAMNILMGNATDCCQTVSREAKGSVEHASKSKNGRVFVVEELNDKGKVIRYVAQSWVWRNKDTVCFDNIEIPIYQQQKLTYETGDISAQQEILQIYQKAAEDMIAKDEKMLGKLVEAGKITESQRDALVLKTVRVGTGYNDLGGLQTSGLEVVEVENMVFPSERDMKEYKPWVDSGINSVKGRGAQLYLARSDKEYEKSNEDIDMPAIYRNERSVRTLKGRHIDNATIRTIKEIENKTYRNEQKLLQDCENYEDVAGALGLNDDNIEVKISREKDWYMVYQEKTNVLHIRDLAMVNATNAQKDNSTKSEVLYQTYEIATEIYTLMLEMAEKGKAIQFEATEDTSYKNIQSMIKQGLVTVKSEGSPRNFEGTNAENGIIMHDMVVEVNKEKMEAELEKVKERLEKLKERREYSKLEDIEI